MRIEVGTLPGLPPRTNSWVSVSLLVSIGTLVLTAVLFTYLPVEDLVLGFKLDPEVPGPSSTATAFALAAARFEAADPISDANKALSAGDTRLWAERSHDGWFVPSGHGRLIRFYRQRYGLRFWQMGVQVNSEAEEHFLHTIDAYADRYNEVVLQAVRP